MTLLDLTADPITLTAALVDVPSVSRDEAALAGAVETALRAQAPAYEVLRSGNAVLARTNLGRGSRVLLAGHLDTVPIADNVPSRREGPLLHGCGTVDMKSTDAIFLHLAATLAQPVHDVTLVFYDCEEIEAVHNGLGRIERELPGWLAADLAVLGEPTDGLVEAGCQGTMRVRVTTSGVRSHSARSWLGRNAIHGAGAVLRVLEEYTPRTVDIDGCTYREGLNAVKITGGVAGNVVPDVCEVDVNFRFAPDRSAAQAEAHVRAVLAGLDAEVVLTDMSPGALPGLGSAAARGFVAAAGGVVRAKYGWTDVSRFSALGIPALNYGPGDPNLAHKRDEHVVVEKVVACEAVLRRYLTAL